jgi:hypothetical protein
MVDCRQDGPVLSKQLSNFRQGCTLVVGNFRGGVINVVLRSGGNRALRVELCLHRRKLTGERTRG